MYVDSPSSSDLDIRTTTLVPTQTTSAIPSRRKRKACRCGGKCKGAGLGDVASDVSDFVDSSGIPFGWIALIVGGAALVWLLSTRGRRSELKQLDADYRKKRAAIDLKYAKPRKRRIRLPKVSFE